MATSGGLSDFQRRLEMFRAVLPRVVSHANEYPKKGRLPEYSRLALAVDAANAMEVHLGAAPSSTKYGPYENFLALLLGEVKGGMPDTTHDLARRALKARAMTASKDD